MKKFIVFAVLFSTSIFSRGNITLPRIFCDGMVLQRDVPLPIWGWADAGERITVRFNGKTYRTIAGNNRDWKLFLNPAKAGGPFTLEVSGKNSIVLKDVLVGDVWFCSGQSNMVLTMERVKEKYPTDVTHVNYPEIRNFFIPTASDVSGPHADLPGGQWLPANDVNIMGFGAASYFFARSLYDQYHVPIGIINSSVGGTPVEAWIGEQGFNGQSDYEKRIIEFKDTVQLNRMIKEARSATPKPVPEHDLGLLSPIPWYSPDFVPSGWHRFWLPGYWEDQGVKGLNGILWFRKEINIPATMTGRPGRLFVGRIVDADKTYVNGVPVGNVTYQYPPRRYNISDTLLRPGKNIIVVRVTNQNGKGGFVPDKPYYLAVGSDTLDLRGVWSYQVGQVFSKDGQPGAAPIFSQQNSPTGLYNTMVSPVIPYALKGFTWYQGEANTQKPKEYESLLRTLIADWRRAWKNESLPFLYVQLPDFMEVEYSPSESNWARLRESQRRVLDVARTAMVVTLGLGEWNDIHPLNKKDVGLRLARAARSIAYGEPIEFSGPLLKSYRIEGAKFTLTFSHIGGGLVARGGEPLRYFSIAGADKKFRWAEAKIDGDRVVVWCDQIPDPKFVRYGWANNPEGANLYNREGLPASPFETGE